MLKVDISNKIHRMTFNSKSAAENNPKRGLKSKLMKLFRQ